MKSSSRYIHTKFVYHQFEVEEYQVYWVEEGETIANGWTSLTRMLPYYPRYILSTILKGTK